jgi:hypothetical protein
MPHIFRQVAASKKIGIPLVSDSKTWLALHHTHSHTAATREAKTQTGTRNVPQSKDSVYNSGSDDDSGLRAYGEDMND